MDNLFNNISYILNFLINVQYTLPPSRISDLNCGGFSTLAWTFFNLFNIYFNFIKGIIYVFLTHTVVLINLLLTI